MIKLSYDVENYRNDLVDLVEDGDTVIELGCHVGRTTRLIMDRCSVIAVDNSPEAIEAMAKLDVEFIKGDVRLHDVLAEVFSKVQNCITIIISV